MNTNTLNTHLENKAKKDISDMVKEILDIINKYDEKYYQEHNSFFLLKISRTIDGHKKIVFENDVIKRNDIHKMLMVMLKDRYYKQILKTRTEDLLNKIELLD